MYGDPLYRTAKFKSANIFAMAIWANLIPTNISGWAIL